MTNLLLSLLILWLVPVLWLAFAGSSVLEKAERLVIFIILGVLLLGFVPAHLEHDGWMSLVFLFLSAALFHFLERAANHYNATHKKYALMVLGSTLFLHALADGVGLGITSIPSAVHSHDHGSEALAYSIVLHRLPAGIGIWAFLFPTQGWKKPVILFALISIATILGYALARFELAMYLDGPQVHIFEYLIAGGLIHLGAHAVNHGK